MDLTDKQWSMVEPLIPKPHRRPDGRGRPWRDPREVLNAVLWILRTGAPWRVLPHRYPPYQTCHRRFQRWRRLRREDQARKGDEANDDGGPLRPSCSRAHSERFAT